MVEAGQTESIVVVKNLEKTYWQKATKLFASKPAIRAIDRVSFTIAEGEIFGLVGESGSGKSSIGKQIVGLETPTAGEVLFRGQSFQSMKREEKQRLRKEIQMIFQDPYASLNPRKRVIEIIGAPLVYHGLISQEEVPHKVEELLALVGLSGEMKQRYPREFSGGQRQRIAIARAIALNPAFIVCDEVVSALDVSVQAQVLNLLRDLQAKMNISMLFIGHDLGAVAYVSDRIGVVHKGKIVEIAESQALFETPIHPYTEMLKASIPIPNPHLRKNMEVVYVPDENLSEEEQELVLVDAEKQHYVAKYYAEKFLDAKGGR